MDRREWHRLHLLQEDEDWPPRLLETDDVSELGVVVGEVVEEVVEEVIGVGPVDEVLEHGA